MTSRAGLLGDTAARDYSGKLKQFNAFAQPELRHAIASLQLQPGMQVVDVGCGTGEVLNWLAEAVGSSGLVIGMELASAHAACARALGMNGAAAMVTAAARMGPRPAARIPAKSSGA